MFEHALRTRRRLPDPLADREERVERAPRLKAVRRTTMVGAEDDPAERQADAMADRVVRSGDSQVKLAGVGSGRIHRSATPTARAPGSGPAPIGTGGGQLDERTERVLSSSRGGGRALDEATSARLATTLGDGVGRVRIHTGRIARQLNEGMQAEAFASGHDVYFRDGMPDTSTKAGMHLLAHEVAHTVQAGDTVGRRIVRRKLIPKVDQAFTLAISLNNSFQQAKTDTDTFANTTDQEDLARVHGRMNVNKGTEQQKKAAHFVRAVVLANYSSRLASLDTQTDESGNLLTEGKKKAKRAVYKQKADEFRQKHTPLVEKPEGSEAQAFFAEHGFEAAIPRSNATIAKGITSGARIDVRSTFIGGPILGIRLRAHLFIVYTGKDGKQFYFRGGPGEHGDTVADWGAYAPDTVDWDPSAPSVTVLEGEIAETKFDGLIEAAGAVNRMRVPYRATVQREYGGDNPNILQTGANYLNMATTSEGENCNAAAWTMLKRAGVPTKRPSGKHPGWGGALGSRTEGKHDAEPAVEQVGDPVPYVIDPSRDETDAKGFVQMYRDRAYKIPLTKLPKGTKAELLDVNDDFTRISVDGQVGYIMRTEDEVRSIFRVIKVIQINQLRTPDELNDLDGVDETDPDIVDLSERLGVSPGFVQHLIGWATDRESFVIAQLESRLEGLGQDRIDELLTNPSEAAEIANDTGATVQQVLEVAQRFVNYQVAQAKLPGLLQVEIPDPAAASMAVNELPTTRTVTKLAKQLQMDPRAVAAWIDEMRPEAEQGKSLKQLCETDGQILNELDNPPGYMVKHLAKEIGTSEAFVRKQLLLWFKSRGKKKVAKKKKPVKTDAKVDDNKAPTKVVATDVKQADVKNL